MLKNKGQIHAQMQYLFYCIVLSIFAKNVDMSVINQCSGSMAYAVLAKNDRFGMLSGKETGMR